jgi:hypothetical protein
MVFCLVAPQVLLVHAQAKASRPESWGIIVGVARYQNFDSLKYCGDDAISLYNQIAPTWGADHLRLLVDADATKSAISSAISSWLASMVDSDDTVLFFFSGHGGQDTDLSPIDEADHKDEYICPTNSLKDSWTNDIRDDELDAWLSGLNAEKMVVMLDTCFSGGFISQMSVAKTAALTEPTQVSALANNTADGFAKDLSKSGRVILTASSESEESGEYDALKHGLFVYYIIDALNKLETTDVNRDLAVSAEEIYSYAAPLTVSYAASKGDSQHPQIYDGYVGELPVVTTSTVSIGVSQGVSLLAIDGDNYSCGQQPVKFTWATNTVHLLSVSPQAYERIPNGTLESPHPYPNRCIGNWTISPPGAAQLRIHFNYIRTERNYDRVYINDGTGNQIINYTGNFTDLWSPWVTGGSLRIRLLSDTSNTGDGFVADCFEQSNERHTFTSWSDGNQSTTRTLTATTGALTLTANYKTEHYLTINSSFGNATGQGWYDDGATAHVNLNVGAVDFLNGTRTAFNGWSGDASGLNFSSSNPIVVNSSKTAIANWKTQFQVSLSITPVGGGFTTIDGVNVWADTNSVVAVNASSNAGYVFSQWTCTGNITISNSSAAQTSATVGGPGTITATFASLPVIPETTLWSLLVGALAAAATAFFLKKRNNPGIA